MKRGFPKLSCILCCTLVFILFSVAIASAEQITITTYYPAPFGVYKELRAERMAIGDTYYDTSQHCWPGGSCGFPDIDANADLVVEGNVGIGTASPWSQLHIKHPTSFGVLAITGSPIKAAVLALITKEGTGLSSADTNRWDIAARGYQRPSQPSTLQFNYWDGATWAKNLLITPSGNVGIGTVNPQSSQNGRRIKLDVTENIVARDVYLDNPRSGNPRWASEAGGDLDVVTAVRNNANRPSVSLRLSPGEWLIEVNVIVDSGGSVTTRNIVIDGVNAGVVNGAANQSGNITGMGVAFRIVNVGATRNVVCTVSGSLASSLRNSVLSAKAIRVGI